jgi:hypothetical protein
LVALNIEKKKKTERLYISNERRVNKNQNRIKEKRKGGTGE